MSQHCGKESYSISKKQNSRKETSLYRWLSKVTGINACWIEGTQEDGSPAWVVIKRIAHTTWYVVRSSLWRKTAVASLVAAPLLFSPAKLTAQTRVEIDSTLAGSPHGFKLIGADTGDRLGDKTSLASGDINGDGIDDLILGAERAEPNGISDAGQTYVVFGTTAGFSSGIELSSLAGSAGFVINGFEGGSETGETVASGDINGDGTDDVVITSRRSFSSNYGNDGLVFVVFGQTTAFADTLELSTLDGDNGFTVRGDFLDEIGYSLVTGDINGDGYSDLVIGGGSNYYSYAYYGNPYSEVFVVFGDSAFTETVFVSGLDGSDGFRMSNENSVYDYLGEAVAAADINGDGYDDLILYQAASDNNYSGEIYVVFGQSGGFSSAVDYTSLNGTNGFKLNGSNNYGYAGRSLSSGDINGDGYDDLIIGVTGADPDNKNDAGRTYVVFGDTDGFASEIELSSLDGSTGFALNGIEANDYSGTSLAAGDVNGDGTDDLVIGAWLADPNGNNSGEAYVVFGQSGGFASEIELSSLDGSTGFALNGVKAGDSFSRAVLAADLDGDGMDDVISGAPNAEPTDNNTGQGEVYVFTQPILNQQVTGDEGFRTLGAPAYGTLFDNLLENFWTQGFTGADSSDAAFDDNVWTWDSGSQVWAPLTNLSTNSLDGGQGFLFYIYSDDNGLNTSGNTGFPKNLSTLELFPGTSETLDFNSGSVNPVSSLDDGDFFFAGNPYMDPIDWDELTKTNLSNAVYVYDDANAQWQSWTGSLGGLTGGIIAPFQGFFIEGSGGSGSLTFEEADTVSASASLLKNVTAKVLKLTAETDERSSNAWLSFQNGGEIGRDDFDALALQSLGTHWLRLATVISNQDLLQINALPPDQVEELLFPLILSGSSLEAETALVSVEGLDMFDGWNFAIHDLETGEVYPLSEDAPFNLPIDQVQAKEVSSLVPASPIPIKAKTDAHRFQLLITPSTAVTNESKSDLPTTVELKQNYPNPFNPATTIMYLIPRQSSVRLEVFDMMGRKVATLVDNELQNAGEHTVRFDASQLASGMYVYRLQIGTIQLTRKLTLIK